MAAISTIEWTDRTWNPVVGCTRISPGCQHCYAERMSARLAAMSPAGRRGHYLKVINDSRHWNNRIELVQEALGDPLRWKQPSKIFVNSMSDLFHNDVPQSFVQQVFEVMGQAHWHQFQVLTKRSERLLELASYLPWKSNIWMGVSVECDEYSVRIDHLRRTNAAIKFLSLEPLLGPLPHLDLQLIDWVIVGGESGPGSRPMAADWVREIRRKCFQTRTPYFFKQWGGVNKKAAGRELDGRTWDQMPQFV
jgi:protein gp37